MLFDLLFMGDEDGDGNENCADHECRTAPECIPGRVFTTTEICGNGLDDDGDDLADCADPDCSFGEGCLEDCFDSPQADEDGNGLANCAEPTCNTQSCAEVCDDGRDNDSDGLADCDDTDCDADPACPTPEDCNNGVDDDGDGLIDCADDRCRDSEPGCREEIYCSYTGEYTSSDRKSVV